MYKIKLEGMEFKGTTGVLPEEKTNPQPFIVTVEMDVEGTGDKTDCLEDTVNYAEVFDICKEVVEGESFNLIERMADEILTRLKSKVKLAEKIKVVVGKPEAPLPGKFVKAEVTVEYGK